MKKEEAIEKIERNICGHMDWCGDRDCEKCEVELAIKALEKQKWNKTSEIKPTEEKQYLCLCFTMLTNRPFYKILYWSNDLYEVDDFDFYGHKGESGFYAYDSEYGYHKDDCDYWQEIDWSDEECML